MIMFTDNSVDARERRVDKKIVGMDHRPLARAPDKPACLSTAERALAPGNHRPILDSHCDNIVGIEVAIDRRYAHGQQTRPASNSLGGSAVDAEITLGKCIAVGNPLLDTRSCLGRCHKYRMWHRRGPEPHKSRNNMLALAIGDNHLYSLGGNPA